MKIEKTVVSVFVAVAIGLIVLKWEWIAELFGVRVQVERSGSMVTMEYALGILAVMALGYVFYRRPILCAIWFVLGPTLITHSVHILKHGVPRLWPVELLMLAALILPYAAIAFGTAYLRRRFIERRS